MFTLGCISLALLVLGALVWVALEGGTPGWALTAPKLVRESTANLPCTATLELPAPMHTGDSNSPLTLALLDVCEGGNHLAPTSGSCDSGRGRLRIPVGEGSTSFVGFEYDWATPNGTMLVLAEVGCEHAPDARWPAAQVQAIEAALVDGRVDKLVGMLCYQLGGRAGEGFETMTPVQRTGWIWERFGTDPLALVTITAVRRNNSWVPMGVVVDGRGLEREVVL